MNLIKKDLMFNWVVPSYGSGHGRRITEDLRVNFKNGYVYLGIDFLREHYPSIDEKIVNVAFLLDGNADDAFIYIEPKEGVPFYKFKNTRHQHKQSSPMVSNKQLVTLFAKTFGVKNMNAIMSFDLQAFSINGMLLYKIVAK